MISPKFYSQITVCPVCSGWGTLESPPKGKTAVCKECYGQGVSVVQSESVYVWNAPSFVDYASRTRLSVLKISAALLVVLILIMFLFFVRYMLMQLAL